MHVKHVILEEQVLHVLSQSKQMFILIKYDLLKIIYQVHMIDNFN